MRGLGNPVDKITSEDEEVYLRTDGKIMLKI